MGAITKVEKEMEGGKIDTMDLAGMVMEIQQVTEKRCGLAESAPAALSSLQHSVGYLADTPFAHNLVTGKADIPSDTDKPTQLVIEEIQQLWSNDRSAWFETFLITKEDFCYYWWRAKESTSSSL